MKQKLLRKIREKSIRVGVVGLGYVGYRWQWKRQKPVLKQWALMYRLKK